MDVGLLEGIMGTFFPSGETVPEHGGRLESIRGHLSILLNTRRGSILHLPDYGLPDSTEVSMKDRYSIADFGKAIEETVRKYEPRLTQVRVKPMELEPDSVADFRLGFLLEAKILRESTKLRALFKTSGSAEVEPEGF
jgi:type VI secretion system protein